MERQKPYFGNKDDASAKSRTSSSTRGYPQSRENSVPRPSTSRNSSQSLPAPQPSNEPELDKETVGMYSLTILKEFSSVGDVEDAVSSFVERFVSNQAKTDSVEKLIGIVLDNVKLSNTCGKLFAILLTRNVISWSLVVDILLIYFECEEDLIVDYPFFWQYIADCLSVTLTELNMPCRKFEEMLLEKKPDLCNCKLLPILAKKV